jgi:integrase
VVDRTTRVACPAGVQGGLGAAVDPGLLLGADLKTLTDALGTSARLSEQSERRLLEVMLRFLRYADQGCGVESLRDVTAEHVRGFVLASSVGAPATGSPSVATSHLRRSAVRLLFRVLRQAAMVDHDPTIDLVLPPRSSLPVRPLTDDEIALGRSFALKTLGETRQPAAWALAEATARTSELAAIRLGDVDLDAARIWLAGSTKTDPRWGQLTDWGVETLARRVATLGTAPAAALIYEGSGSAESRQASGCAAISETLRRAGLAGEADVRPTSITAWAGQRIFAQTGQIEAVARGLGMRSLDRAARLIGWDWTTPDRPDR